MSIKPARWVNTEGLCLSTQLSRPGRAKPRQGAAVLLWFPLCHLQLLAPVSQGNARGPCGTLLCGGCLSGPEQRYSEISLIRGL